MTRRREKAVSTWQGIERRILPQPPTIEYASHRIAGVRQIDIEVIVVAH